MSGDVKDILVVRGRPHVTREVDFEVELQEIALRCAFDWEKVNVRRSAK